MSEVSPKSGLIAAHEFADLFPLHEGPPLWQMADDIKANGLHEQGWVFEGLILDGRRRQLACLRAKVEFKTKQFKGTREQALAFVVSKNLHRRHLGDGERAMIAAKISTMTVGNPTFPREIPNSANLQNSKQDTGDVSQSDAAKMMGISPRTVASAKKVNDHGTKELQDAVKDDTISVSDAAAVASEPAEVQDEAVEKVKAGEAKTARAAVIDREPGVDEPDEEITDAEGETVPECAIDAFVVAKELTGICREINALLHRVEVISKGPGGRLIRFESFKQQIKDAKGNLWSNRATHVCPYCHGKQKAKPCECCKNEGWTAKHVWQQAPGREG